MGFVVIATWVAKDGEAERVLGEAIPNLERREVKTFQTFAETQL